MKYLTVNQVAEKLHYSIPSIYRKIRKREIPYIKQGHRVLFLESDIDEWMLSHRVPALINI